jgi:hypothetical protein
MVVNHSARTQKKLTKDLTGSAVLFILYYNN